MDSVSNKLRYCSLHSINGLLKTNRF